MDGTITETSAGLELRFERELQHSAETVWQALTDPDRRAAWFFTGVLEPQVGGTVDLLDAAHGIHGVVSRAEPPHLLEFSWSSKDAPRGLVRFEIRGTERGCSLTFTHLVDHSARPGNLLPGWHCIFDDLPEVLAGQAPADDPDRFRVHKERYAAAAASS